MLYNIFEFKKVLICIKKCYWLKLIFVSGIPVYNGYVDDPRNTDNAWMETSVYNFHDDHSNGSISNLQLVAGDDAKNVTWMDISSSLKLYASHKNFIQRVSTLLKSHW